MAFEEEYQKPYQFLQPKHMTRGKFVDMITAICMAHRDHFTEYADDALDGNGSLNEEYCVGTSHVIACMVAQRTGHPVETECPMSELLLQRIKPVALDQQRSMVDDFLKAYE